MSHIAQVDVQIMDLDALAAACRRLGLELVRGQQTYRWYGESVGDFPLPEGFATEDLGRCEHAIRLTEESRAARGIGIRKHDPYEIGICRRRDGKPGYALLWDFFKGGYGLQTHVGEDCKKLRQMYALETAKRQAIRSGFRVTERAEAGGKFRLVLQK
jgi:hypothetical protein